MLYWNHSSSSRVTIFWHLGAGVLVMSDTWWKSTLRRQQINAAFARREVVNIICLFNVQNSFTSSRPILPLAISMFRTLTSTLCPTRGSHLLSNMKSDFSDTGLLAHLEFPSWSSHLACVDQTILSVSEYITREVGHWNTFPTPTSTKAPKCVTLDTLQSDLGILFNQRHGCLLYTSDAADE